MAKKKINHWALHHANLGDEAKLIARKKVMTDCEFSLDTFYRKMKAPDKLKFWEKSIIAKAYGKKVENFFPEPAHQAIPL